LPGGGVSLRYLAYSLALELGQHNVDAMLETMTAMQFNEWVAYFRIKSEKGDVPPQGMVGKYGTSPEGQRRMNGDILRAMIGYQKRWDKLKAR
jgi:hypothetical protein